MAVCLTLNLVTQAKTRKEAIHKLHGLMHAYLQDAVDNNEFDAFVPRRAPARFYAEYAFASMLNTAARIVSFTPHFCAYKDQHKIPAHA